MRTRDITDWLLPGITALTVSLAVPAAGAPAGTNSRPNIVFFLIDDLGWADIGCNGSTYFSTPNIDRLAKAGMRFTDAYAACGVCSPTRASILTGKYPARLHLTDWIPGEGNAPGNRLLVPEWQKYLSASEATVSMALNQAGYRTASIGKWHLGGRDSYPDKFGFEVNIGGGHIGHPAAYFWPYEGPTHTVPGLKAEGKEGEYLTDRLTAAAERFIDQNRNQPFFLYFPHYAVHTPLQGKPELVATYRNKTPLGAQTNAVYAAMIESVDESVGRIMRKLETLGLAENTVVIFTSDNGGLWPRSTVNAPLRAGKGHPYEGGIRVPLLIKWPGVTRPGGTVGTPVMSIDFLPTVFELLGAKLPGEIDGVSLMPLLRGQAGSPGRALFWHYPHYWSGGKVRPYGAVRAGDWKLVEWYEDGKVELYNLKTDASETRDLAEAEPERVKELKKRLQDWRKAAGAQMPRERE